MTRYHRVTGERVTPNSNTTRDGTVVDDQARNLREEVANSLKGFNDGTQNAFRTLVEFINSQLREFGDRLNAGTKNIDEKVEGIGTKQRWPRLSEQNFRVDKWSI